MYGVVGEILMCACLAGIALSAVALFVAKVLCPAWDEIRGFLSKQGASAAVLVPCVVGLVMYAGSKTHISFTDGIRNAGGSYVTNDTIHIEWQRDTSHVVVPLSSAVYIDYRETGSTNEWGLLAQSVVSAGSWNGTLVGATNYDYHVWAYYIPPEPAHTNDVWTYKTMRDRSGGYVIPLKARTEINGRAIATPAERRKDEEE